MECNKKRGSRIAQECPQECPHEDLGRSRRTHRREEEGRPLREEESQKRRAQERRKQCSECPRKSFHQSEQQAVGGAAPRPQGVRWLAKEREVSLCRY